MATFVKRRAFQNGCGTAIIDVVFDEGRGRFLHIIRRIAGINGDRHENVNRVVFLDDVPERVADEALSSAVNRIIAASSLRLRR